MSNEYNDKIKAFAAQVEKDTLARLIESQVDCEGNRINARTQVKPGSKYDKVNIGGSGRYMVEVRTGNIYGIKGYGVPHKGHFYGTLDTIADYFWGGYYPEKLDGSLKRQTGGSAPVLTFAPVVEKATV